MLPTGISKNTDKREQAGARLLAGFTFNDGLLPILADYRHPGTTDRLIKLVDVLSMAGNAMPYGYFTLWHFEYRG